jgi:Predicted aminopeptidases
MSLQDIEARLRRHVHRLAVEIGERNVFRPNALHAAESYIREQLGTYGYEVKGQAHTARGVESANLEATRTGVALPQEILLLGAHYDSVLGSPGANDNASAANA